MEKNSKVIGVTTIESNIEGITNQLRDSIIGYAETFNYRLDITKL